MCVERNGVFIAECKNMREKRKEKRREKDRKTSERASFILRYRFALIIKLYF